MIEQTDAQQAASATTPGDTADSLDPLWYKDAIIYEVHVKTFMDSNGDGIGDFKGLTQKLDYLRDLGVTAIWLLPFYPSPLRDDGYDIADYTRIHPNYGTMRDFRTFMREAHKRGLRVITELVVNHTSDQHPWFQRARQASPGSSNRNFYVWSETGAEYREARIIFQDFESSNWTWDPVAKAYFWHRFYSHQPDLNYDNPKVAQEIFKVMDYWLDMGVAGLRLDAVPYLFERDGTNCENLQPTHEFLKKLRAHVDYRHGDKMLLAEANQWSEDSAAYFGDGDECHMAFQFPVMPRLFMAVRMEDSSPIINIMEQTPDIPANAQWAMFLRNHDELTLEMVTDEERDYMYRMYAHEREMRVNLGIRRRLAPLLNNDRRKIELLNGLLFSLPGTPVIYYGDEIGMGDNFFLGDRNGVRTPMQWNGDRNAGFSRANPQRLYSPVIMDPEYHYEAVNVEVQEQNTDSLLWWMKRLISLRKSTKAFGRGSIQFLRPSNPKVLAFLRKYEDETVLVVANLSRFPQHAELDLSQFEGSTLSEMFGGTEFPAVGAQPYSMVLGRYIFYWFTIKPRPTDQDGQSDGAVQARATLQSTRSWETLFREDTPRGVPRLLAQYLPRCRWFGSKGHTIRSVTLEDVIPVRTASSVFYVTLASIEYRDIESETYLVPLAFASGDAEQSVRENHPWAVIGEARINVGGEPTQGIIYDGFADPDFGNALLGSIMYRRNLGRGRGRLATSTTRVMGDIRDKLAQGVQPRVLRGEQSNTSLVYDEASILKLFRKLTRGVNPDLEIGRFLAEKTEFQNAAPVAGAIEYTTNGDGEARTVGILQGYIPNHGDAWTYTDDALGRYYEQVLAVPDHETPRVPTGPLGSLREQEPPEIISQLVGPYLVLAQLIGKRTAEMHAALGSRPDDPEFAPEPFTRLYQRSLYQGMRNSVTNMLRGLRPRIASLPEDARADAEVIARSEGLILGRLGELTRSPISAMRIRCHGDYHLGQVLYTGGDFVIIDFEGEPARPLGERRLKRSPMRDVGGMVRSFHYAAHSAMLNRIHSWIRPETVPRVERWAQLWYRWVAEAFLEGYVGSLSGSRLIPEDTQQFQTLLDMYLIDKAVYEVMYEINNRPSWSRIPLRGLAELVGAS